MLTSPYYHGLLLCYWICKVKGATRYSQQLALQWNKCGKIIGVHLVSTQEGSIHALLVGLSAYLYIRCGLDKCLATNSCPTCADKLAMSVIQAMRQSHDRTTAEPLRCMYSYKDLVTAYIKCTKLLQHLHLGSCNYREDSDTHLVVPTEYLAKENCRKQFIEKCITFTLFLRTKFPIS